MIGILFTYSRAVAPFITNIIHSKNIKQGVLSYSYYSHSLYCILEIYAFIYELSNRSNILDFELNFYSFFKNSFLVQNMNTPENKKHLKSFCGLKLLYIFYLNDHDVSHTQNTRKGTIYATSEHKRNRWYLSPKKT